MSESSLLDSPARVKRPGIYSITCTITGRIYVGGASNIPARWKKHRSTLNTGTHHNARLQADYNRYGPTAFTYAVIEECAATDLSAREQFWIHEYNSDRTGYNIYGSLGGLTGHVNKKRRAEPARAASAWARVFNTPPEVESG